MISTDECPIHFIGFAISTPLFAQNEAKKWRNVCSFLFLSGFFTTISESNAKLKNCLMTMHSW